jgi:hypothetical protein
MDRGNWRVVVFLRATAGILAGEVLEYHGYRKPI